MGFSRRIWVSLSAALATRNQANRAAVLVARVGPLLAWGPLLYVACHLVKVDTVAGGVLKELCDFSLLCDGDDRWVDSVLVLLRASFFASLH